MEEVTAGDTLLLGEADIVAEGLTEALLPTLGVPEGVGVGEALGHTSLRMTLPLKSATSTVPEGEEVTPTGAQKLARLLMPSRLLADPEPARVPTEPLKLTDRSLLLELSATSSLGPSAENWSRATPKGLKKLAPPPTPSIQDREALPARVLTEPPGLTTRMRLLRESPT